MINDTQPTHMKLPNTNGGVSSPKLRRERNPSLAGRQASEAKPLRLTVALYPRHSRRGINYVFISPHFDDAVLSCGQLISKLIRSNRSVSVITVFTKSLAKTVSPQAIDFLRACKFDSAYKLFKSRKTEDIKALRYLKVTHVHLDHIDAAWRKDGKGRLIYANSDEQFSGDISSKDNHLFKSIKLDLLKTGLINKYSVVFAPLGIGGHADHVIINKISQKIKSFVIFWEDYPYNQNELKKPHNTIGNTKLSIVARINNAEENKLKVKAIKYYKSQTKSLFPKGFPKEIPESYFALADRNTFNSDLTEFFSE